MKTAIVIGATGLVGKSLVEQLARQTDVTSIKSLTRRPIKYTSPNVVNEVVDFDHLEKYSDLFQGDYFFSCLGTTIKQAGSKEAQWKVDFEYQYEAAKLAVRNGVPHYLLVSASMANSRSLSFYPKMKGALEDAILKLPFAKISIMRPSLLLGERENVRPAEHIAGIVFPYITRIPGLKKFRPIRGDEVALKMIQVSKETDPGVRVYELDEVFPE